MPNPNTMAAAQNATSGAPNAIQSQQAQVGLVPFGRAAKLHAEQGVTQANSPWLAAQQQFLVPSYGYLSGVYLTIAAINGTSAGAVVATADAPFNVLGNLLLADVNGTPLVNLDGYAAYLMRLYGGYRLFGGVPFPNTIPPASSSAAGALVDASAAGFSPVQLTSGAGAGNFKYIFELFPEFSRDGLGALPNMDASAAYKLTATFNPTTTVYTTPPATLPILTSVIEMIARGRPSQTDAQGNPQETQPPAPGTVQYWTAQTFPVTVGSNTLILSRVGNIIRNHILVFRDAAGVRATADSTGVTPTVLEFDWDAGQRYIMNTATLRQWAMELNGFDNPAGVIPLQNTSDPNGIAIAEYGDGWMPTVGATKLQLRFTAAAAGTVQVITNDIVPGGDIYQTPALVYGR